MLLRKFLTFLAGIISVLSCQADDLKPRIVGGEECDYTNYPYAVTIFHKGFCGGSILTLSWILTAGHCINPDLMSNKQTILRTGFDKPAPAVQIRYAIKGVLHENFSLAAIISAPSGPELRYDIGLIKVDEPFTLSPTVQPAKLPTPGFTKTCTMGTAIGTGLQTMLSRCSNLNRTLFCVDLPIVDHEVCLRTWPTSVFDESVLCTMEEGGGKDACKGDSGGPLDCRGVLIGVISLGKGCASPNTAATYVRVESYLDFINETVYRTYRTYRSRVERVTRLFCLISTFVVLELIIMLV